MNLLELLQTQGPIELGEAGKFNLHQAEVHVFCRKEDEPSKNIAINQRTGQMVNSSFVNPSPRRQGVSITFRNELGDHSVCYKLDIWQHKGSTYLDVGYANHHDTSDSWPD